MVNWKDPLHVELGQNHKKVLETLWVVAIVATIVLVLVGASLEGWPADIDNSVIMLVIGLIFILGFLILEKSSVKLAVNSKKV
jgi:RsiW-degrading membrane proteinase PrsW (M82 family)